MRKKALINAGRQDVIDLQLQDYRTLSGQYDAVVSCEMIEAVGKEYLDSYFEIIASCLKPSAKRSSKPSPFRMSVTPPTVGNVIGSKNTFSLEVTYPHRVLCSTA